MPDLLVRGLSDDTAAALRDLARAHGRSMQSEVLKLIEDAVARERRNTEFWELADALRERTRGRPYTDAADIIREDRERDMAAE